MGIKEDKAIMNEMPGINDKRKTPLTPLDWIQERKENCLFLAKSSDDSAGWLLDAAYFEAIEHALTEANKRIAELDGFLDLVLDYDLSASANNHLGEGSQLLLLHRKAQALKGKPKGE